MCVCGGGDGCCWGALLVLFAPRRFPKGLGQRRTTLGVEFGGVNVRPGRRSLLGSHINVFPRELCYSHHTFILDRG